MGMPGGRNLAEILELIDASGLAPAVKSRARALFHRLAEAEAKAHGMAVERVHFHEVGAVDSIVDLVGAAAAVEWLAPRRITCGAVNLGGGTVRGAHGLMPVPPPAVAELMRGLPVYGSDRSVGRAPDADRGGAARRTGGRVRGTADAGRRRRGLRPRPKGDRRPAERRAADLGDRLAGDCERRIATGRSWSSSAKSTTSPAKGSDTP